MSTGFRLFIRHGLAIVLASSLLAIAACSSPPTPSAPRETPTTAARLVFTTQPVGAGAGTALATQPVVTALDASGNVATGYRAILVLTITAGSGAGDARLIGGTTVMPVNGVFHFAGLSIDKVGSGYTVTAKSGSLSAVSAPFDITPGAAAQLAFTTQPSGGIAGSPLTSQPVVSVLDNYGNMATGYNGSVTLGISYGVGPGGAKLNGTTLASVVNGVARFTNLSMEKASAGYTLTAMGEGLASAISDKFEILPGAPAKLGFSQEPRLARATKPFFIQPRVEV